MSKRHFSWLLALTLVVAAIILLVPGKTGHESAFEPRALIPEMEKWVNEVSRVRVVKAGNQNVATLVRLEQAWVVEDAQSYPADWASLRTLLAALAQAEVIELKTTNPAYFDRLGVLDVADPASTAIMVEISKGEEVVSILIGTTAQGREGQYVRFLKEDQALLVDQTLNVASETRDWLQRDIVDLSEAEVVEVTITHPDGEQVSARKSSADEQNFTLQGLPQGREIQSSWSVNSLGGSLSGLQMEEVTADNKLDWTGAIHIRMLTADGVEVNADLTESDEKSWLRLAASAYAPQTGEIETGEMDQEPDAMQQSVAAELEERVGAINRHVKGWAYSIPEYKSGNMKKRLEDLLKPIKED